MPQRWWLSELCGLKLIVTTEFILDKHKSLNNCEFCISKDDFNEKKIDSKIKI